MRHVAVPAVATGAPVSTTITGPAPGEVGAGCPAGASAAGRAGAAQLAAEELIAAPYTLVIDADDESKEAISATKTKTKAGLLKDAGDMAAQLALALDNVEAVLGEAGMSLVRPGHAPLHLDAQSRESIERTGALTESWFWSSSRRVAAIEPMRRT